MDTKQQPLEWSGSCCPQAPDTCWIDDSTAEHVNASTGVRTPEHPVYELRRVFYNAANGDIQSFGTSEYATPADGYNPAAFGIYTRHADGTLQWVEDIADYDEGLRRLQELNGD